MIKVIIPKNISIRDLEILEKFPPFKNSLRSISINSLLGKKCQLEVTDIKPKIKCGNFHIDRLSITIESDLVTSIELYPIEKNGNNKTANSIVKNNKLVDFELIN